MNLETVEARYKDLLERLGVRGHEGAIAEIEALRENLNDEKSSVTVGKYTLTKWDDENIWISFENGEGGQFPIKTFEAVIAAYYQENF